MCVYVCTYVDMYVCFSVDSSIREARVSNTNFSSENELFSLVSEILSLYVIVKDRVTVIH